MHFRLSLYFIIESDEIPISHTLHLIVFIIMDLMIRVLFFFYFEINDMCSIVKQNFTELYRYKL